MLEQMIGQLKAELAADKKKAVILGILSLVGCFLLLKLALGAGGPDQAGASIIATGSGTTSAIATARPQVKSRDISEYLGKQDMDLSRNIFAADFSRYPVGQMDIDDDEPVIIETENKKLGEGLELQSTLNFSEPTAIINGRVLTIGDRIGNCRVVNVAAGYCVLRSGDTEFTLKMKSTQ